MAIDERDSYKLPEHVKEQRIEAMRRRFEAATPGTKKRLFRKPETVVEILSVSIFALDLIASICTIALYYGMF